MKRCCNRSLCLSHAPITKTVRFKAYGYYITPIGNHLLALEAKPTHHRGRNGLDLEKFMLSLSRKRREIEVDAEVKARVSGSE